MSNAQGHTGYSIPIELEPLRDILGAFVTGFGTSLRLKIRRRSDGFALDFSDMTFKAIASVTTIYTSMSEVHAVQFAGEYRYDLDLSSTVNPNNNDVYSFRVEQAPATVPLVTNLPQVGTFRVAYAEDEAIFSRKMLKNRQVLSEGSLSNFVLYDDDDVTVIQTWNVKDKSSLGIAIANSVPAIREPV